jgi:lysozyme
MNLEPAKKIIREFEGFKLEAYLCPAGKWTIGYGQTYYPASGLKVLRGDKIILSKAESDLELIVKAISQRVKDMCYPVVLNENQHNALVSFAYNVGLDDDEDKIPEGFGDSTLLKKIHWYYDDDFSFTTIELNIIANEFPKWIYSKGKKLDGLVKRRNAEKDLFLKPVDFSKPIGEAGKV